MTGKRQLQKAQTKEKITVSALKMYSENGFSTPTIAIANDAQVSHGSIFVHFPTADDLLIYSIERFSEEIGNELRMLTGSDDIAELLGMHIDVLIRHEDLYKRLIKESVYLPKEARSTLIAIQSALSFHFMQALEKAIDNGNIKDVPFHMIFNTWLGLIQYYLMNGDLFAPDGSVLEQYKDSLIKYFLKLIEK